jgi:hypothetical protein
MFSLTSPNATRTQLGNSSARVSRRTTHSVKIIGAAAIALLGAGNNLANSAENPARTAQEQHACAVVRGLDSWGRRYDACIRSLDRSLSEWDYVRFVSTDRGASFRTVRGESTTIQVNASLTGNRLRPVNDAQLRLIHLSNRR